MSNSKLSLSSKGRHHHCLAKLPFGVHANVCKRYNFELISVSTFSTQVKSPSNRWTHSGSIAVSAGILGARCAGDFLLSVQRSLPQQGVRLYGLVYSSLSAALLLLVLLLLPHFCFFLPHFCISFLFKSWDWLFLLFKVVSSKFLCGCDGNRPVFLSHVLLV